MEGPDVGVGQFLRYLTHEGLNYKGPDGHPEPRLAESWTSSPNGLQWTFQLRSGVHFHDGTPLDAEHVARSLNLALERPGARALRPGLLDVTRIAAVDGRTLVVELKRPSSFLVDDLDMPIESTPAAGENPVGTGPFRVVASTTPESVLEANERYYLGAPNVKRITVRAYTTLRTAWAALMRAEIDMVSDVAHDAIEFMGNDSIATHSFLRNYVYLIAFNSQRPQLREPTVRRALNSAIDRAALIDNVMKGHGVPASGPLWPRHWAFDGTVPGYTFEASLASSTLEALGLKLPAQQPGGRPPSRLRFVCLVPRNFSVLERLALSVQRQLYDIGVDMQVEAVSAEDYNVRIRSGDFDAIIVDMIGGPSFARAYSFWRSPGELKGFNVFGYANTEADRWFDALRYAADDAALRAAASQLQRVLREDPPALFLAWNERTRAISRRFEVPTDGSRDPLYTLRLWSLNAGRRLASH